MSYFDVNASVSDYVQDLAKRNRDFNCAVLEALGPPSTFPAWSLSGEELNSFDDVMIADMADKVLSLA